MWDEVIETPKSMPRRTDVAGNTQNMMMPSKDSRQLSPSSEHEHDEGGPSTYGNEGIIVAVGATHRSQPVASSEESERDSVPARYTNGNPTVVAREQESDELDSDLSDQSGLLKTYNTQTIRDENVLVPPRLKRGHSSLSTLAAPWRRKIAEINTYEEPNCRRLQHLDRYLKSPTKMLIISLLIQLIPSCILFIRSFEEDFGTWEPSVAFLEFGEDARSNLDAFRAAQEQNSAFPFLSDPDQFDHQTIQTSSTGKILALDLIYEAKTGNIFDDNNLSAIKAIEDAIVAVRGYDSFCLREPISNITSSLICAPPLSVMTACIPERCPKCEAFQLENSCEDVRSTPPGLLNCANAKGCSRDELVLDTTFKEFKLLDYSRVAFSNDSLSWHSPDAPGEEFLHFPDANFGSGNSFSRAVRSQFRFGLPLPGYAGVFDRRKEQEQKVKDFIYQSFNKLLEKAQADDDKRYDVYWSGFGMDEIAGRKQLSEDHKFLGLCLLSVWFVLALCLKSWLLSTVSMISIMSSFAVSYLLLSGVMSIRFIGIYMICGLLVVVGFGMTFPIVWMDFWALSAETSHLLGDRLSWTWRRTGRSLCIASFCVSACLSVFISLPIPAIRAQSVMLILSVLVQTFYVLVCYPAYILFYQKFFAHLDFMGGLSGIWSMRSSRNQMMTPKKRREIVLKAPLEGDARRLMLFLPYWFQSRYSGFLLRYKILILLVTVMTAAVMSSQGSLLEISAEDNCFGTWCYRGFPSLLLEDSNLELYREKEELYFSRGYTTSNLLVNVLVGLDTVNPLKFDLNKAADPARFGTPNWLLDGGIDLQFAFTCFLSLCDATSEVSLRSKNDAVKITGTRSLAADCWASELCAFIEASGLPDCLGVTSGVFESLVFQWFEDPVVFSKHSWKIFGEQRSEETIVRGSFVSVPLNARRTIPTSEGVTLYRNWIAFLVDIKESPRCLGLAFQLTQTSDSPGWEHFQLLDQIEIYVISTCSYSILVAFGALTLAMGNVFVGILAGTAIGAIYASTVGFIAYMQWHLSPTTSMALVTVPAVAILYVSFVAEQYTASTEPHRKERVTEMLSQRGGLLLLTTILISGCASFLWGASIRQYQIQVGIFVMAIVFVTYFTLLYLAALLATIGPNGNWGSLFFLFNMTSAEMERSSMGRLVRRTSSLITLHTPRFSRLTSRRRSAAASSQQPEEE